MKKIIFPLLAFLLIISCNNNKETTTTETTKDSAALVSPPVKEMLQKVTYVSATFYTGRTDFYFTDENGESIEVGISNFPEDKGAIYPKDLMESTDTLEGIPSENPLMVGKPFFLVKDTTGKLLEIRAVN